MGEAQVFEEGVATGTDGVATGGGYRALVARLSAAQKSGAGVPAYLRWVNRALGRRLAAVACLMRLRPNHVTMLSALASAAGVVIVAVPDPRPVLAVAAASCLLLGYALDSADGQLARLTGAGSRSGEFLDHVVDAVRLPAVHAGIAVGLISRTDMTSRWPALVAVAFMVVSSAWFFGQILADSLRSTADQGATTGSGTLMSWVKLPHDVGFLYLLVATYAWPGVFIAAYSALCLFTAGVALLSLRRKYRWLGEDDGATP